MTVRGKGRISAAISQPQCLPRQAATALGLTTPAESLRDLGKVSVSRSSGRSTSFLSVVLQTGCTVFALSGLFTLASSAIATLTSLSVTTRDPFSATIDLGGDKAKRVTLTVDGDAHVVAQFESPYWITSTESYSLLYPRIQPGPHVVRVQVIDIFGETAEASGTLTLRSAPATLTLSALTPEANHIFTSPLWEGEVSFRGILDWVDRSTEVRATLDGVKDLSVFVGTNTFFFSVQVPFNDLSYGQHELSIQATDTAGGSASTNWVFYYYVAPTVTFGAPVGERIYFGDVPVDLQASSPQGEVRLECSLTDLNGERIVLTGTNSVKGNIAVSGEGTFLVNATDTVGARASVSQYVFGSTNRFLLPVVELPTGIYQIQGQRVLTKMDKKLIVSDLEGREFTSPQVGFF